jgi:hypothetical protein
MKALVIGRSFSGSVCGLLCTLLFVTAFAEEQQSRSLLVLTSTNSAADNEVVVFELQTKPAPVLSFVNSLPTGAKGGASTNAGILQFRGDFGAVANYGSNNVSPLARHGDSIEVQAPITLASGCVKPDSVAISRKHLFVVGATCAESYAWPAGTPDGAIVHLGDPSAAQIVVGKTWAAVTLASGSLIHLGLAPEGGLNGAAASVTLPSEASNTPLGEAFWGDILGFTPAHSPDSFAIVNPDSTLFPIVGPTPPFPANAPCWVAKGPGNIWYTGNSPGHAISIFFSDDEGGLFYKSVALPGAPTDLAVSRDQKWLAVIYSAGGAAYVAVFAIDAYGGLALEATSAPIGAAAFNGIAISE